MSSFHDWWLKEKGSEKYAEAMDNGAPMFEVIKWIFEEGQKNQDKPLLRYANGNREIPKELWDIGDALLIYVNEGDLWNLSLSGKVELQEYNAP